MIEGYICGIDEAGRGPLAGSVCAGAVILPDEYDLEFLGDSKKLSATRREVLFDKITAQAVSYGVGWASVEEIETLNILGATMLAMRRAVEAMSVVPTLLLVDGTTTKGFKQQATAIKHGDAVEPCISAASIIAKVSRDREMLRLSMEYPDYGFEKHMGYGTKAHYDALRKLGPTPIHRKLFLRSFLKQCQDSVSHE